MSTNGKNHLARGGLPCQEKIHPVRWGRRILDGADQAPNIIADVRQQAGMTLELAQRAARRAYGADRAGRIQSIRLI